MSFSATVLRVLIASPSDLVEERKAAIDAVYDWNAQHSAAESIVLLPVAWETHSTPRSGVRPQAAINEQLVDTSDVLIGMFWTKLGTTTGVAESGTTEEIDRFVAAGKPTLLYFSNRLIDPDKIDLKQHKRLKAFKAETYKTALVGSFVSPSELREAILRNMLSQIRAMKTKWLRLEATPSASGVVPSLLRLSVGEDHSFVDHPKQTFYSAERRYSVRLDNISPDQSVSECHVHLTGIHPVTACKLPRLLKDSFSLAAGDSPCELRRSRRPGKVQLCRFYSNGGWERQPRGASV